MNIAKGLDSVRFLVAKGEHALLRVSVVLGFRSPKSNIAKGLGLRDYCCRR